MKKEDASNGPLDVVVVEDEDSAFVKLRRRNWARLIRKVYLENPALCPACGEEMKIIAAITSPHQDDVIEKILKATGQWAPPWRRERRARGPPRQLRVLATEGEGFSQVSPEGEEEFNQLPSAEGDA